MLSIVGACDSGSEGNSCNTSADCGGGICRDKVCVLPCTRDEACAVGELCNVTSGICYTPKTGAGGASAGAPAVAQAGAFSAGGSTAGAAGSSGVAGNGAAGSAVGGDGGGGASGGTSTSGGASGAGGAPVMLTYELIDDLEDNDARIAAGKSRQGPWHIFNDQGNGGNQQPRNDNFLPEKGGANGTMYAVHTSGEGFGFAGVGFDLNNPETTPESSKSQPYDASAWDGVAFWAKGTAKLRVEIPTRNFVPQDRGGSCTNDCWNVYGGDVPELGTDWREYRIPFSALKRESGATEPAFMSSQLMSISFRHDGNARFDFWVDEVRFYTARSVSGAAGASSAGGASTAGGGGSGGTSGAGSSGAGTGGS